MLKLRVIVKLMFQRENNYWGVQQVPQIRFLRLLNDCSIACECMALARYNSLLDNNINWYLFGVIVRVRVVFRKTVVDDWRFDYLSGSHLQSQVKSLRRMVVFMMVYIPLSDDDSSLDSEDDYRSGSGNVSHQQQSF